VLQIANPFAVAAARRALREFRPDVAFVLMFERHLSPAVLTALRGVPTVLDVLDYKPVCPLGWKLMPDRSLCEHQPGLVCLRGGCLGTAHWLRDQPRYALLRAEVARVDRVLTISRWMVRELARSGIAAENFGLPVPPPSPGFRRAPAPEPLIVFVGRLSWEKGVAPLLRAFARVRASAPSARLRLIGDGAERADLEALAAELELGEAVSFAGWLDPDAIERELVPAWATVAPSLWAEPLGLVAVEAIVRGVPVIASAHGGFADTVEPGVTGLLFENGDEDGLARRLAEVAGGAAFPSHALEDAVARRARETYSPEAHVAALERVFREVAATRRAVRSGA
jgi:glycosyltransferase involved in cell wall biosynthesis